MDEVRYAKVRIINKGRLKPTTLPGEFDDDEYVKELREEIAVLKQLLKDTTDGMECLESCDSYGHDDLCPVAHPEIAWRKLREENEQLKKENFELKRKNKNV